MTKRMAISIPDVLDELVRETAWQRRTTPSKVIIAALEQVLVQSEEEDGE